MVNYYNEFDKNAATWLRELIRAGLIAPGDVDERSIMDVEAKDLEGYIQHHFFAGVGGWSYALRLAGWPDEFPVWTASLPCQPFSAAGKGLGKADERHLLPHFLELVKQCRPDVIFGEQVERAIAHGWLDDLQTNMEAEGYAIGHCVLGAHSSGGAHIRQRLYWVADSNKQGLQGWTSTGCANKWAIGSGSMAMRLGIPDSAGSQQRIETTESARHGNTVESAGADDCRMANTLREQANTADSKRLHTESTGSSFDDFAWIQCRDGKLRPIEPGILPLAHGIPKGVVYSSDPGAPFNENTTQEARKMRLHGYGNAIVPQVAAEFIKALLVRDAYDPGKLRMAAGLLA